MLDTLCEKGIYLLSMLEQVKLTHSRKEDVHWWSYFLLTSAGKNVLKLSIDLYC